MSNSEAGNDEVGLVDDPIPRSVVVWVRVRIGRACAVIEEEVLRYHHRRIAVGVKRGVVYHLIETRRIPYFKVGAVVCARRSKLLAAFEELEETGARAA